MVLGIILSDSSLRQNNLNWHSLGVQACHIQLFNSLDTYLPLQFFAVVVYKLEIFADRVQHTIPGI